MVVLLFGIPAGSLCDPIFDPVGFSLGQPRLAKMMIYFGCGPLPVTVTTRIIAYLVGDSYKPSFATVTGRGPHPRYTQVVLNCM